MKFTKLITLTIFIAIAVTSNAQEKEWTLYDCINYAIENNITVKKQEINSKNAKLNRTQAFMEILPGIETGISGSYSTGKTLNTETYEYVEDGFKGSSIYAGASMEIFNGLQQLNRIQKSKLDLLSQLEDVKRVKNDITISVTMAYMQILFDTELLKIAEEQLSYTTNQIEKTQKLYDIGNAAKKDLLQIKSQAASEKVTVLNAKNNLELANIRLIQLLNLESTENIKIFIPDNIDALLVENISDASQTYNSALEILPQVKSAEYLLKSAQKDINIAWGTLSPSLRLNMNWGSRYNELSSLQTGTQTQTAMIGYTESGENVYTEYDERVYADKYPYLDQIRDKSSSYISLNLSIPIFNKYRRITQISRAKLGKKTAQLNLDETKQALYQSIQEATSLAGAAMERYKAGTEEVKSTSEAFKYTEQKFQVGLADAVEYQLAKTQYITAQANELQAKYEYILRTKILNFYKGEQIKL